MNKPLAVLMSIYAEHTTPATSGSWLPGLQGWQVIRNSPRSPQAGDCERGVWGEFLHCGNITPEASVCLRQHSKVRPKTKDDHVHRNAPHHESATPNSSSLGLPRHREHDEPGILPDSPARRNWKRLFNTLLRGLPALRPFQFLSFRNILQTFRADAVFLGRHPPSRLLFSPFSAPCHFR